MDRMTHSPRPPGRLPDPPGPGLAPYVRQKTVLLTTYKRDGSPVGTPVHIAVDGDHAYVRTYNTAWKVRRLRHDPRVALAPSTTRGVPTGPATPAHARLLDPASPENARAARLLARKYPLTHGVLVPLLHRAKRVRTLHYELRLRQPTDGGPEHTGPDGAPHGDPT